MKTLQNRGHRGRVVIEGNRAYNVLCSDGVRRNARLFPDHYFTDSEKTTATVKAHGYTVSGFVQKQFNSSDLAFVAFQNGRNGEILRGSDPTQFKELDVTVYSVVQSYGPYMPDENGYAYFTNRKDAERYMAEEKRRIMDEMQMSEVERYFFSQQPYAKGSAREGTIVIFNGSKYDLGWNIVLCDVNVNDLTDEDRKELGL